MLRKPFFSLLRRKHCLKLTYRLANLWLVRGVVEECATEEAAAFFEDAACKVTILIAAVSGPTESSLERKTVY